MLTIEQRFLENLRRSQWLSPERLAKYQQGLLERLVRHAATQTSHYPDRLSVLFKGPDPETAEIDFGRWQDVPVTTRAEAVNLFDQLKARSTPAETGGAMEGASSGTTTGIRLRHLRSATADVATMCLLDRALENHDVDMSGSLAYITDDKRFVYPEGGVTRGWNRTAPEAKSFLLGSSTPPDQQLEWLERVRPDHVMSYPVTFLEVAEAARKHGSRLKIKTFIASGETYTAETRDTIVSTFGCKMIDVYAAREIGQIAFQCPVSAGYHINAETVLCEFLDDEGRQAAPGTFGHVVLTPLYNYAMPFIRYDIGDYALVGTSPCSCGRGLPMIAQVAGRTRSRFVMPDGTRKRARTPFFTDVVQQLGFKHIQFVQTDVSTLEIRYIPDGGGRVSDEQEIARQFRQEFYDGLIVRFVAVDHIHRGEGKGVEQFVSLVSNLQ